MIGPEDEGGTGRLLDAVKGLRIAVVVDFWRLARVGRHLPLGHHGDMGPSFALHDRDHCLGRRPDDDDGDLHNARAGIRRRHTPSILP